jgi:hypothetical protein
MNLEWKLCSFVLSTEQCNDHSASGLQQALQSVIDDWKIIPEAITTDNAAPIVKAIRDSGYTGVRCFAHTLNLGTQKATQIRDIDNIIIRVRRIVQHFHQSGKATSTLESVQTAMEIPKHILIMDVTTRWNSTYDMLCRFLEQESAVQAVVLRLNLTALKPLTQYLADKTDILGQLCEVSMTVKLVMSVPKD